MKQSYVRPTRAALVRTACAALVVPLVCSHAALAQTITELDAAGAQVCRVSWQGSLTGENTGTARGTAEIVRRSGDPDTDTYHLGRYMGEGIAEVSLTPPAGCRITSGSPRSIPYNVFVRSNDGQTVEVVHSEAVSEFAVALQCGADNVTRRMEFRSPGTLYPELRDGETLEYDITDFDGGASYTWWWRGTMSLGLCAPGERDYPPLGAGMLSLDEPAPAAEPSGPVDQCAEMLEVARVLEETLPEQGGEFRKQMRQICPNL